MHASLTLDLFAVTLLGALDSSGNIRNVHYWKRVLCRGPEALPRAKYRALGKETLCRGPDTGALGKERPSAKRPLPRVRPSAKTGPRQIKSLPRASALGKDTLGKVGPLGHGGHFPSNFAEGHPLGPRQRFGKFFFKSLPRAPDQALGKDFLKTSFWPNFFFINRLCRGPEARPSAKKTFAEGQNRPSAKSPQQFFSVRSFAEGPDPRPSAKIFYFYF